MKKFISTFCVLFPFVLCFNQSVAIAQTTRAAAATASASMQGELGDLDNLVDQNSAAIDGFDQATGEDQAAESRTTRRYDRIYARAFNHLQKRLPQTEEKFGERVDQMSEDELVQAATQLEGAAPTGDAEPMRALLKASFHTNLVQAIPAIARGIADAGGTLNYVRALKHAAHEKAQAISEKRSAQVGRWIASSDAWTAWDNVKVIGVCLVVVLFVLGFAFTIGALAVIAGVIGLVVLPVLGATLPGSEN